jgi:hypothetical protein
LNNEGESSALGIRNSVFDIICPPVFLNLTALHLPRGRNGACPQFISSGHLCYNPNNGAALHKKGSVA